VALSYFQRLLPLPNNCGLLPTPKETCDLNLIAVSLRTSSFRNPTSIFGTQELYTSGLLSSPRLICLFIFCYKPRKSWLRSCFGLEVNTLGVYALGPRCAKVRFFSTWFSHPTFMPIFLTIFQFSRHLFSESCPFNLFPVFLFIFFPINISFFFPSIFHNVCPSLCPTFFCFQIL